MFARAKDELNHGSTFSGTAVGLLCEACHAVHYEHVGRNVAWLRPLFVQMKPQAARRVEPAKTRYPFSSSDKDKRR